MKQLLLNGCSFGECWQPTSNFLQKLGCDTVENISKSGTSFQRTCRTTIEWIAQHDSPHYVIIPITFSHRWELALNVHEDKLDGSWVPLQNSNFLAKEYNIQECDLDKLKLFVEDYYKIIPTIKTYWDKMFTEIVMLSGWLESNKINYLMFDMCNNFEYEHIPIDERTETVIHDLVVRENIVTFDQIYEVVFSTFTDNLTPPYRDLVRIISKFAEKIHSGPNKGKWKLKIDIEEITSQHDFQIGNLAEIGKKLGYDIWVGSVEQGHIYKDKKLSSLMSHTNIELEGYNDEQLSEIKQIDLIWYKNKKVEAIFEIEHSTSIISALRRGSQISNNNIKRYIIIKESGSQRNLLERLSRNPFFKREFQEKNWEVKYYNNVKNEYKNVINNNESPTLI